MTDASNPDQAGRIVGSASRSEAQPAAVGPLYARVPLAAVLDPEIDDGELRTLALICAYMKADNHAWPSQGLMAFALARSRSTVNRHVKALEKRGHVNVNRYRHQDGSRRCTYRVNFTPKRLPQWPGKSRS